MEVRITDKRIPRRIGQVGDVVDVPERFAKSWLHRNLVALPDDEEAAEAAPEPSRATAAAEDFEGMEYNDLRALAAERGIKPKGRKKVDYIAALQRAGTYNRRDLRAED